MGDIHMTTEQQQQFYHFITGDDLDFYEEFILELSDEEQKRFFQNNPEFMSEFSVNCDRMELLKDKNYRGILRKIKRFEEEYRNGSMSDLW